MLAFVKGSRLGIDFDDIEIKAVIGGGASSTIYRGIYHSKGKRGQEEKVKGFDGWGKYEEPGVDTASGFLLWLILLFDKPSHERRWLHDY